MSSPDQKHEPTRLERLAAIVREEAVDVGSMDSALVAEYLKANNVDMAGSQKRFDAILKKAKTRRQLEVARERRLQASEKARAVGAAAFEQCRERVRNMIERIRQNHPEQALFYAREYERATEEDMQVLEEDLMLLEMDDPDNGKSDKQDAG
jgi:hypothetical protein